MYLSGNLTRDPEVRYLDGGRAVTNFTIANNKRGKDGKDYATFVRCAAWTELGLRVADQARKGDKLIIEGELTTNTWTDKAGKKHEDLSVTVMAAEKVIKPAPTQPLTTEQEVPLDLPF